MWSGLWPGARTGNSWRSVLRYVAKWNKNPSSEDVWLAVEDFWVEREIIRALAHVNKEASKLTAVTPEKDGLRQRTFAGRTWELKLQLVDKPNGSTVQGTIKNLSNRLQPFNVTNELVFNIWLSDSPLSNRPEMPYNRLPSRLPTPVDNV